MGTIVGFDLTPFLTLARARGYSVALIAELLHAAERGMLEGIAKSLDKSSGSPLS